MSWGLTPAFRQARRSVGEENLHDDVACGQNSAIVYLDVHAIHHAPLRISVFERRFKGNVVDGRNRHLVRASYWRIDLHVRAVPPEKYYVLWFR